MTFMVENSTDTDEMLHLIASCMDLYLCTNITFLVPLAYMAYVYEDILREWSTHKGLSAAFLSILTCFFVIRFIQSMVLVHNYSLPVW